MNGIFLIFFIKTKNSENENNNLWIRISVAPFGLNNTERNRKRQLELIKSKAVSFAIRAIKLIMIDMIF